MSFLWIICWTKKTFQKLLTCTLLSHSKGPNKNLEKTKNVNQLSCSPDSTSNSETTNPIYYFYFTSLLENKARIVSLTLHSLTTEQFLFSFLVQIRVWIEIMYGFLWTLYNIYLWMINLFAILINSRISPKPLFSMHISPAWITDGIKTVSDISLEFSGTAEHIQIK